MGLGLADSTQSLQKPMREPKQCIIFKGFAPHGLRWQEFPCLWDFGHQQQHAVRVTIFCFELLARSSGCASIHIRSLDQDFTLTHFYISGPGPRCTEPIRSEVKQWVWVKINSPGTAGFSFHLLGYPFLTHTQVGTLEKTIEFVVLATADRDRVTSSSICTACPRMPVAVFSDAHGARSGLVWVCSELPEVRRGAGGGRLGMSPFPTRHTARAASTQNGWYPFGFPFAAI